MAADAATAAAGRAARAETAATAERKGGRRGPSALSQPPRRLLVEAGIIVGGIVLAGFLIYHFTVHVIRNPRPLGGANVDVSQALGIQTQAAIAVDPRDPRTLLAASNDGSLETLRVYTSHDGGATWAWRAGPAVPGGSCAHGEPHVAFDAAGRQYLAFLAGTFCGDELTPYLVVAERDPGATRWHLVRVVPKAWEYGFDDGPALAVDQRSGAVYVAFERSFSARRETTVVSRSVDHGRTWSTPVEVSSRLVRPHLAAVAVGGDGTVYVAGIDVALGVWVARSTDGGRTFEAPRQAARLVQNPAGGCALAAYSPVPREQRTCIGPDPALAVRSRDVAVVYGDGGANGAGDVFATMLDRRLRPLHHGLVNPPDGHAKDQQFMPVAAADPSTGTLWACWYDTTFDPNAHRAWFTCSASRDGRRWAPPVRAASVPSSNDTLMIDSSTNGFYPALVADRGVAHPVWIDGRRWQLSEELFTAAIPQRAVLGR